MIFAEIDEFWDLVEKGFSGVVFIPAEETENVHLERLIRMPGISVVILPALKCD